MKFEKQDKQYLQERKVISEKYGPRELWNIMDHWPLYVGVGNLSRFLAILDIVKLSLSVPGHIAEFGSWRGANLMFMTKLLSIFDPHGSKEVHCFDSFEGLTAFSAKDLQAIKLKGEYKGSYEELEDFIHLYKFQDDITIHKGLIENTLVPLLKSEPSLTFSLIYCDTDLYDSTKAILENLHPRLSVGGLFVFDEWNFTNFPGEGLAVNEFLKEYGSCYEVCYVKNARQPTMYIKKIKHI